MHRMKVRLLFHLSLIYLAAAGVGTILLTVDNIFINRITFSDLLQFNLPAVLSGDLVILLLLLSLSAFYLRNTGKDERKARAKLMKLPARMFVWLLLISIILSCVFHYLEFVYVDEISVLQLTDRDVQLLFKSLVSEQSIALVIGTLQYALSRRAIRPYIIGLTASGNAEAVTRNTFVLPMTVASASCFYIVGSVSIEYLISNRNGPVDLASLLTATAVHLVFAVMVFYMLIHEMRGDLRIVLSSIGGLLKGGAAALHGPIPVVSADELGQLTEVFNQLQKKMAMDYEEVRQELMLAYNVQQKLLPQTFRKLNGCEIAAVSSPSREIGGDLFDIVELRDGGLAVMVGDVSGKGIAAAMLMSAALVLFRSEVRNGGSPGQVLTRLNALLAGTLRGNMYITMSLGIWNAEASSLQYASAGHVSPYLLRKNGELAVVACSSLPLGIDAEEAYEDRSIKLSTGDSLLLYTDGIVESGTEDGGIFGFESFERLIAETNVAADVREQLRLMMERLPKPHSGRYDDDRTIVLLRLLSRAAKSGAPSSPPVPVELFSK